MLNKVIVMVSDLDDASHGKINVLDGPDQAAHFVETLLESGCEQERVRVFGGDELQMQVHQRPVVSLIGNARSRNEEAPRGEEGEGSASSPPAPQGRPQQEQVAASETVADRAEAVMDEVAAQPFVRNGVRFSSQFRPARPGSTRALRRSDQALLLLAPPVLRAPPLTPVPDTSHMSAMIAACD